MNKFSFPIRLKVLVAVLVMLMLVIGVITATMANLFQQDKTAYVRDFSAAVTGNMQAEIGTILDSRLSAARVLAEVLFADYIDPVAKQQLAKPMFGAYPDLLALVTLSASGEPVSLSNNAALRDAGIEVAQIRELSSLTESHEEGTIQVRHALGDSRFGAISLTLGHRLPEGDEERAVVALIASADLTEVLRRGRPLDSVLLDADRKAVVAIGDTDDALHWARLALESFEGVATSGVFEYSADGHDYIAGVSKSSIGDLIVVTRISATAAYLTARQLLDNLVLVGLVIVLIAAIFGVVVSRRITRPLERNIRKHRSIRSCSISTGSRSLQSARQTMPCIGPAWRWQVSREWGRAAFSNIPPACCLHGRTDADATVFVDEIPVEHDRGRIDHPFELRPGANIIVVKAIDGVGNLSYASLLVNAK